MSRKLSRKSRSKPSSAAGDAKPEVKKVAEPGPWSSWQWSIEDRFYYRARKGAKDEWEYEINTPKVPKIDLAYYERPKAEYPKEVREIVYVSGKEPVYESTFVVLGGEQWEEAAGSDAVRADAGELAAKKYQVKPDETSKEPVDKKEPKEEKDEEKGDGKKASKEEKIQGLKKKDVDEWRHALAHGSDGEASAERECLKRELKEKKKDKHVEKEYERKQWRRRETRR